MGHGTRIPSGHDRLVGLQVGHDPSPFVLGDGWIGPILVDEDALIRQKWL